MIEINLEKKILVTVSEGRNLHSLFTYHKMQSETLISPFQKTLYMKR